MTLEVNVASVQFDIKSGDKGRNLSRAIELLEKAAEHNVDIAAIPDYFLTGYPVTKENVAKWAETIPGPTTDRLSETAKVHKMYIVGGSIIERENERFYCTCPVFGRDGNLVGKYRKVNFWMMPPLNEADSGLTPGTDYPVFRTDFGVIGVLLQVDIDFPETARVLALKGAEIIFWLTGVDYPWIDVCRCLARAYAFSNLAYLITVNRTGTMQGYLYYGESTIINPMGEIIASAGQSYGNMFLEDMAIATIDLQLVRKLRQMLDPFGRRKPDTFRIITRSQ